MIEISYDKNIIENHSQRYPNSCIPSCVEMVLKIQLPHYDWSIDEMEFEDAENIEWHRV